MCKLNVFATPECTRQANDVVVMEFTFSLHLGLYIMCSLSNPTICCLQSFSRPQLLSALHTARPGPWLGSSWVIEVCWAALFEANLKPREQAEAIDCVGRFENSRSPDHCVFGRFQGQLEHLVQCGARAVQPSKRMEPVTSGGLTALSTTHTQIASTDFATRNTGALVIRGPSTPAVVLLACWFSPGTVGMGHSGTHTQFQGVV